MDSVWGSTLACSMEPKLLVRAYLLILQAMRLMCSSRNRNQEGVKIFSWPRLDSGAGEAGSLYNGNRENGGFGRKERRPGCDRCEFWQGATHEGQMWLWPTLSRIRLASLLLKHWLLRLFLSARITLLLCCLLRRLPCVRSSMIGTFHFRAFKVFLPLF